MLLPQLRHRRAAKPYNFCSMTDRTEKSIGLKSGKLGSEIYLPQKLRNSSSNILNVSVPKCHFAYGWKRYWGMLCWLNKDKLIISRWENVTPDHYRCRIMLAAHFLVFLFNNSWSFYLYCDRWLKIFSSVKYSFCKR